MMLSVSTMALDINTKCTNAPGNIYDSCKNKSIVEAPLYNSSLHTLLTLSLYIVSETPQLISMGSGTPTRFWSGRK